MYSQNRCVCSHVPRKYVIDTQLLLFILLWLIRGATQNFRECARNTWVLTLSPNFHRHLRSSHLRLVYNDPSDFAIFGSTHWSLPALSCLVPDAILLGSLQWIRNAALSTGVSFYGTRRNRKGPGQVSRQGGEQWSCYFLSGIPSQQARCMQARCHGATTSLRSSTTQAVCASHFPSVVSNPRSKTSHHRG